MLNIHELHANVNTADPSKEVYVLRENSTLELSEINGESKTNKSILENHKERF